MLMALAVLTWGHPASAQGAGTGGPLLAAAQREGTRLAQASTAGSRAGTASGAWIVRHPVITGTAIGAGAGLLLSQVDSVGGRRHDPRLALVGAGTGAWGGLLAGAVHSARTGKRVGPGTKIGIAAGAIAAGVLPVLACYGAGGCGGSS